MFEGVGRAGEKNVVRLEQLLRASDTPVLGRLQDKALILDLRCLQADQQGLFVSTALNAIERLSGS